MTHFRSLLLATTIVAVLGACTATTGQQAVSADTQSLSKKKSKVAAQQPPRRSTGGGHSKSDFYNSYDTNEDGSVSVEEYRMSRDAGYDARDPNGDGEVLADEYVAEYEARLAQDLAEMRDRQIKQAYVRFGILDQDKDGVLSREEFQAAGSRMFARLDTNQDNIVNDDDTKDAY